MGNKYEQNRKIFLAIAGICAKMAIEIDGNVPFLTHSEKHTGISQI